jgi:hypothetical protein
LQAELVAQDKAGRPDEASRAAIEAMHEALFLMHEAWGSEATAGYLFDLAARVAKGGTRGPARGQARTHDAKALAAVFWTYRARYPSDHACAVAVAADLYASGIGHSELALHKAIERAKKAHPPRNMLLHLITRHTGPRSGRKPRLDKVWPRNKV